MKPLRLGTRKSALAQAQSRWVIARLQAAQPKLAIETVLITTSGDRSREPAPAKAPVHGLIEGAPIPSGGLKAMFTKEIEEALLENRIDVAVHSLKDMAAEIPPGLELAAVPEREDPRDVWIGNRGIAFRDLPTGATIATGAVRRQAQLRHLRPDVEIVELRGNVDTRLKKIESGDFDGMVLALAGLKRLHLETAATEVFTTGQMLPAIGQGALAIEARAGDAEVVQVLRRIDHPASHHAVLAERAFLKTLGGSCQTPIAAYAQVSGKELRLSGLVVAPSGDPYLQAEETGEINNAAIVGQKLAMKLLSRGADRIL
jgi:hydroxymethylbilane synthase